MENTKKKKFRIAKWIFLALAVLSNAFIVVYSSIDEETTVVWNNAFTKIFASLINTFTNQETKSVQLEKIELSLSNQEKYAYNYLNGYEVNEIPLGSAKQIECNFFPEDATNKSVTYNVNPEGSVLLNQSGSLTSVVGMKVGDCVITAKSNDGGFESSVAVKVVETVAPTNYEISLDNTNIAIGTTQTIKFDIDGGVLTHDELINFRYYDTRKLTYSSSDESVATVDNYGVIYPVSIGSTIITVSSGEYIKSVSVNISDGTAPTPYANLSISGSDVCYGNDMILDQNSKKNHYQLTPKDGETELNPEDFIWSSSNELLVKVDKHGVMRGFRKTTNDDENAIITAKSKLTGQEATFNVIVKNQLPTGIHYSVIVGDKSTWKPKQYTLSVGDVATIKVTYTPDTQNRNVFVACSNEEIISFSNEGNNVVLYVLKEGKCNIKVTSQVNPELSFEVEFNVIKKGAIDVDNIDDVGNYLRKSVGHAMVFLIAQVFTFLTLFMFFYDHKWWFYSSISLGEGLFISILSELIQFFVPTRGGVILDVLIDFAGVVVGAALSFLGIFIVKKIIAKKKLKETTTDSK